MKDIVVRKFEGRKVVVGCRVRHSSGVNIFYFTHNKGAKNKMNFNFILN